MIEAAVVGLGRIGAAFQYDPRRAGTMTHAAAWKRHPASQLVAGVDPDSERRRQFTEWFAVPAYPSWKSMMKWHNPGMVSIATPASDHGAAVLTAIDSGAERVICEKPCTSSLNDAIELEKSLGDRVDCVGVNFTRRFDPMHQRLLGVVARQGIRRGVGHYTAGISNTGSHWLDGIHRAGAQVAEVLAVACEDGPDPTPTVMLKLVDGGVIVLLGASVHDYMIYETDLFTATGRVKIGRAGADGIREMRKQSHRYSEYSELYPAAFFPPCGLANAMLLVIDDAVRSAREARPMRCTIPDAIKVHRIISAVRESLVVRDWIQL